MHRILLVLFCIIFVVVGINGVWIKLVPSVNEDAIELAQLAEQFWSLKPAVFQRKGPLVLCQFIDECCSTENRFQAISFIVSSIANEYRNKNRYARVLNSCINSTAMEKANQSCPLLNQIISPSITQEDKFDIIQHRRVIVNYYTQLNNLTNHVYESCNNEEIHALLCLSNTKLIRSCVNKILQEIYDDNGYDGYQEFIIETKKILIDLNQQLSSLSMKNKNTD
jgi:hypothetical protein